ncbi:MAG: GGDEF domain-containing protein [Eubacterium sp.]|nr:GGDEF domain-containing protein [Eubacterium sp.]
MSGAGIIETLKQACANESGLLTIVNMDNFILFNDIYGAEMGDRLIEECVKIIDSVTEGDDIKARLGGDEFLIFCRGLKDKKELAEIHAYIDNKINESLAGIVGEENNVSMGISMGAVLVPEQGTEYEKLFQKASKALEYVKQSGGRSIAFYELNDDEYKSVNDLERISDSMEERGSDRGAMWLNHEDFSIVYRFLRRYIETYENLACKMLITFTPIRDDMSQEEFNKIFQGFGSMINALLRRSDIMMQSRNNQFYLLLPEMNEKYMELVAKRIEKRWKEVNLDRLMDMSIDARMIEPTKK